MSNCHQIELVDKVFGDKDTKYWHCIHCNRYWPEYSFSKECLESRECLAAYPEPVLDCKSCIHKRICDIWRSNECQDASCYVNDCYEPISDDHLKDIANLQACWLELVAEKRLTKKAMCDLCIPFRDKYNLPDSAAIAIARGDYNVQQIYALLKLYQKGEVNEKEE